MFNGTPGQTFLLTIDGDTADNFGPAHGRVTLHGRRLVLDEWTPTRITGQLPINALPGPIVVTTADSHDQVHDAREFHDGYGVKDRYGHWHLSPDDQVRADVASRPNETEDERQIRRAAEDAAHADETEAQNFERMRLRQLEDTAITEQQELADQIARHADDGGPAVDDDAPRRTRRRSQA